LDRTPIITLTVVGTFLLSQSTFALVLYKRHAKTYNRIQVSNYHGNTYDPKCVSRVNSCLALKAVEKFQSKLTVKGLDGYEKNAFVENCVKQSGAPFILSDIHLNQYDFCKFSDGSFGSNQLKKNLK
jgi:hypothetical protein